MSFISLNFVTLFVCTFLLYYTLPPKYRKAILLLSSCIFIGYYHIAFLIIALLISLATFFLGKWVGQSKHEKDAKRIYISGLCFLITGWLAFRYANLLPGVHWLFPLGISFYTFQALSYLTEIYWKEEEPEENLADFMIYMLFFMKFLSGPIERARDMLPQLKSGKPVAYPSIVYGMKLIAVGLIKKLILADYISPYIDGIFNSIHTASGIQLLMACLLYPVELYGDFSGYTDIALGGACMLGFKLSPNFNRPFIAQTTAEFWRRWHMSLSFWVRDYLYLPLSSGMRRWGQWGVFLSLSLTFAGLGAWHGAGCLQPCPSSALICFSPFLCLESVSDALYYIRNISFSTHASWKEVSIGIPDHNCIVAGSALVVILVYEYFMSKRDLLEALEKQPMLVRWGIYYLLAIMFFTLGQFNSDSFIYLQF